MYRFFLQTLSVLSAVLIPFGYCNEFQKATSQDISYNAFLNITYRDPITGDWRVEYDENGRYGKSSRIDSEQGWLVHIRTADNKNHGCSHPVNVPSGRWIALIERGSCKFHDKISNAAIDRNASAVVIYNDKLHESLVTMHHNVDDVVSIFLSRADGLRIANILDNGTKIWIQISVGSQSEDPFLPTTINKTSVLFVSISFIVLMIISLAWLVFYYIQRFRYAHAKERLSRRQMSAAKKAITRMSTRTMKSGDKETECDYDPCAVCIDNYKPGDVVRVLPCKHIFHKSCVDPWLIEKRSCPMCKLDILKAFGLQIHSSRESMVYVDLDAGSTSVDPSELMTGNGTTRDDNHIVELVYYPYNVHLRVRLPETRSEAEETITGLEPAIPGQSDVNISELDDFQESHALIPKATATSSGDECHDSDDNCVKNRTVSLTVDEISVHSSFCSDNLPPNNGTLGELPCKDNNDKVKDLDSNHGGASNILLTNSDDDNDDRCSEHNYEGHDKDNFGNGGTGYNVNNFTCDDDKSNIQDTNANSESNANKDFSEIR